MFAASIVCPVLNTGIFMGMVALFFRNTSFESAPETYTVIVSIFGIILMFNAIPELILNVVLSPAMNTLVNLAKRQLGVRRK